MSAYSELMVASNVHLGPEDRPHDAPPKNIFGNEMKRWIDREANEENPIYRNPHTQSLRQFVAEQVGLFLLDAGNAQAELYRFYFEHPEYKNRMDSEWND